MAQVGNDVPLEGVTPAEALVLSHAKKGLPSHFVNAGGFPLHTISAIREAKELKLDDEQVWREDEKGKARTDAQELSRLKRRFKVGLIDDLFPGASPKLPQTFTEIEGWAPADQKVVDEAGPKTAPVAKPKE